MAVSAGRARECQVLGSSLPVGLFKQQRSAVLRYLRAAPVRAGQLRHTASSAAFGLEILGGAR